jgi:hypothetical protein
LAHAGKSIFTTENTEDTEKGKEEKNGTTDEHR